MHMIMTAAPCCKQRKGAEVEVADVRKVYGMFSDLRRSTQYLIEYNKQFMFNEIGGDEGEFLGYACVCVCACALPRRHTCAHSKPQPAPSPPPSFMCAHSPHTTHRAHTACCAEEGKEGGAGSAAAGGGAMAE